MSLGIDPVSASIDTGILVVGRDAVAVEAALVGSDPRTIPVIQEAMRRDLGEGDIQRTGILGTTIEAFREEFGPAIRPKG